MSDNTPVAIVTGASRGLGRVIAQILAARGYDLVVSGRDERTLRAAADALRSPNRRVVDVSGDVADPRVRSSLVSEAAALGGLNVLVNNASELGGIAPLAQVVLPRLERLFAVNVAAPIGLTTLALPLLRERRGLIVNVSSDAARAGYPGWGAYGATKAALDLVTATLDVELREHGIGAVSVDPGDIRTAMQQEAFPGEDISDRPAPEVTAPFWNWLFDQPVREVGGARFAAQQEDAPWLQPA